MEERKKRTGWIIAGAAGLSAIVAFGAGFAMAGGEAPPAPAMEATETVTDDVMSGDIEAPTATSDDQAMADLNAAAEEAMAAANAEMDRIDAMDHEDAMAAMAPAVPVPSAQDRRMLTNKRQIVEMLELSCNQSGYNCAEAKLLRRQYNESLGL